LFVSNEELIKHIPAEILPDYLGGIATLNHSNWLADCNKLVTHKSSTCYNYYTKSIPISSNMSVSFNTNGESFDDEHKKQSLITTGVPVTTTTTKEVHSNRKRQSTSDFFDIEDKRVKVSNKNNQIINTNSSSTSSLTSSVVSSSSENINSNNLKSSSILPLPFEEFNKSIQNDLDNKLTVDQLIEHVTNVGPDGLSEEFLWIRQQPFQSSIDIFKHRDNFTKNRYRDVVCLDDTRVVLDFDSKHKQISSKINNNDYIHANYVDGYKQKNAYISTQGPLDDTVEDF
jgi:tyrosine-protein phosphatase non-receptor type 9